MVLSDAAPQNVLCEAGSLDVIWTPIFTLFALDNTISDDRFYFLVPAKIVSTRVHCSEVRYLLIIMKSVIYYSYRQMSGKKKGNQVFPKKCNCDASDEPAKGV